MKSYYGQFEFDLPSCENKVEQIESSCNVPASACLLHALDANFELNLAEM